MSFLTAAAPQLPISLQRELVQLWASPITQPLADMAMMLGIGAAVGFGVATVRRHMRLASVDLQQREHRLRLFMDSVTDVSIYLLDPDGLVIHWDKGAERLMQYAPEEIIGQHFSKFYTEEDQRNRVPQDALASALVMGRHDADNWVVRKDRTGFWASGIIQPVTDDGGRLIGYASIVRDCTDRWLEQHDLRDAKEQAESAAAVAEQMSAEWRIANFELTEANDRLQRFTSIVAHDLRAPLRRVEAFTSLLQEQYGSVLDDDGQDIMVRIERGVARLRLMLSSLLDYSKCSRQGLDGKVASLGRIVEAAIEDLGVESATADIRIDLGGVNEIAGDPQLIGHVLQNLISNSIKFRREDQKPIIAIDACRGPSGEVQIRVTDNGIGVEAQFADKVFDMFYRLHDEDEYAGVGIGLSVCRKIIGDHGGRIWIDKAYTGGTRVVFTLQAAESAGATGIEARAA